MNRRAFLAATLAAAVSPPVDAEDLADLRDLEEAIAANGNRPLLKWGYIDVDITDGVVTTVCRDPAPDEPVPAFVARTFAETGWLYINAR